MGEVLVLKERFCSQPSSQLDDLLRLRLQLCELNAMLADAALSILIDANDAAADPQGSVRSKKLSF